ncbi:unnamed protein product [Penicillium egyptiacum]|uniref:Uncharacterized protein n=1 Tax=Penicillium egyptiacum TaxID=1303716 RepID=A0A9W4KB96_9EURO|nr:unnamed protein product [Penicillium egyptiacum]
MARFAYKVDLSEEEDQLVLPLTQLIMEVLTLHNDYYSWEKEDAFYHSSEDKLPMANAVTLYMRWYSLPLGEAKAAIKAKAIEKEEQYLAAKEEFLKRDIPPPPATIRWLEIIEHMVAGNLLWSLTCPRYHKKSNNQYVDYYEMRCRQGYIFPDDCTRLDAFGGFQTGCEPQATVVNGNGKGNHVNVAENASEINGDAGTKGLSTYTDKNLAPFDETVIKNPSHYVMALPSKCLREKFVWSLNQWFQVPEKSLQTIENAVGLLHNCSIMLDDIQDQSPLRRGKPSTHTVYGEAQTMNSAYFLCVEALQKIYSLGHHAVPIYIEELQMLHLGQAQELYWTYHGIVPSKEDHLRMIDGSYLFRIAARLLQSESKANRNLNVSKFMTELGRFFQVRDDYQNLTSAEYTNCKGFCEDLDEGKLSFPIIHALRETDPEPEIQAILEQRKRTNHLTYELKRLILDRLRENGSLDHTFRMLQDMYVAVWRELERLEVATGQKNWMLRMMLQRLKL